MVVKATSDLQNENRKLLAQIGKLESLSERKQKAVFLSMLLGS